ncbi:Rap/ran-GAP protein, partial [Rhizopus stolonifer]
SSISSLAESMLNVHITPPSSPMKSIDANTPNSEVPVATTIKDYAASVIDRCFCLLDLFNSSEHEFTFAHLRELETIGIERLGILIEACDESFCAEKVAKLRYQLKKVQAMIQNNTYHPLSNADLKNQASFVKLLVIDIQHICQECFLLSKESPSLSCADIDGFKKETPKIDWTRLSSEDYKKAKPDQINMNATWFRHYFVGKPYYTFIGPLNEPSGDSGIAIEDKKKLQPLPKRRNSKSLINTFLSSSHDLSDAYANSQDLNRFNGIISVIQERTKSSNISKNSNSAGPFVESQYRVIIRSKEADLARHIVNESTAKETLHQLELRGESYRIDKAQTSNDKRLRSFMNKNIHANENISSRMLRAAVLSVCPNIDLRLFKELSAESTIMAGLEKDLLKYDEIQIPKHYKFGVLTIKDNQPNEEAWFSNTEVSTNLKDFLNIIGQKIELKGYTGYGAGLDRKTGESGKYSFVSKWNEFDIMFHVAPLMPIQKNDRQQVMRKRYIGNVLRNSNVNDFGPALPSPPIFHDYDTLKEFLTLKLINAENASLKSNKFRIPNNKARVGLLSTHIQTGLAFHQPQVLRSASTNRLVPSKSSSIPKELKKAQRPRSVNDKVTSRGVLNSGTSRLLQEAILDEEKRKRTTIGSTEIPPMPSISRSTLLQDFKKGIVSSSKKLKEAATGSEKQLIRKSSQLKVSSKPVTSHSLDIVDENSAETNKGNILVIDQERLMLIMDD